MLFGVNARRRFGVVVPESPNHTRNLTNVLVSFRMNPRAHSFQSVEFQVAGSFSFKGVDVGAMRCSQRR